MGANGGQQLVRGAGLGEDLEPGLDEQASDPLAEDTRDTLKVVFGGADQTTESGLRGLAGVASVAIAARDSATTTFDVSTVAGASADVQRLITGFAVEAGLTLISNAEETLDLETVFLRLIDQKDVAA